MGVGVGVGACKCQCEYVHLTGGSKSYSTLC